jgi:predicted nucleic acid-binding protein
MPAPSVVVDASIAIREIVDEHEEALDWFAQIEAGTVHAAWSQLAFVEIANGLATLVRARRLDAEAAVAGLAYALAAPIDAELLGVLAQPALALALAPSISALDACYIMLAEAGDAMLGTADRKLATATKNAVLVGH